MKKEFEVSLATCEEIWLGRAGWERLFETPNFFVKYKHFIVLEASAKSEEDQVRGCVGYLYLCKLIHRLQGYPSACRPILC